MRGFQGDDLADRDAVAATAKHFCAYGAVLAGREYASVDVSERTLHEVYLPPFAAAVAAGCAAVMPAFMDLAGVPMTAHRALLAGWLRRGQGFEGVIVSDYNAIAELLRHGVAADLCEAAALALEGRRRYRHDGRRLSQGAAGGSGAGLVAIEDIDASVRRVLTLKQRLGLFDDFLRTKGAARRSPAMPARELARDAARRSIVVLTNDGALPLAGRPAQDRGARPARRCAAGDGRPLGDGGRPRRLRVDPRRAARGAAGTRDRLRRRRRRSTATMSQGSPARWRSPATPISSCCALARRRR